MTADQGPLERRPATPTPDPLAGEDLPDTPPWNPLLSVNEQQRVDRAIKQIERLTAETERLRLNITFARIVRGDTDG